MPPRRFLLLSRVPRVRFGSLADITARSRHVRFTPDSGHSSVQVGCPKSAISGQGAFLSLSGYHGVRTVNVPSAIPAQRAPALSPLWALGGYQLGDYVGFSAWYPGWDPNVEPR